MKGSKQQPPASLENDTVICLPDSNQDIESDQENLEMDAAEVLTEMNQRTNTIPDDGQHLASDNNVYYVDDILDRKWSHGRKLYLIKWSGNADMTWEPQENLTGCDELLDEFESKRKQVDKRTRNWSSSEISSTDDNQEQQIMVDKKNNFTVESTSIHVELEDNSEHSYSRVPSSMSPVSTLSEAESDDDHSDAESSIDNDQGVPEKSSTHHGKRKRAIRRKGANKPTESSKRKKAKLISIVENGVLNDQIVDRTDFTENIPESEETEVNPLNIRFPDKTPTHRTWCSRCSQKNGKRLNCQTCCASIHEDCLPKKPSANSGKTKDTIELDGRDSVTSDSTGSIIVGRNWSCGDCLKALPVCTLCSNDQEKTSETLFRCFRCSSSYHSQCMSDIQPKWPVRPDKFTTSVSGNMTIENDANIFVDHVTEVATQFQKDNRVFFREWKCPMCLLWDATIDQIIARRAFPSHESHVIAILKNYGFSLNGAEKTELPSELSSLTDNSFTYFYLVKFVNHSHFYNCWVPEYWLKAVAKQKLTQFNRNEDEDEDAEGNQLDHIESNYSRVDVEDVNLLVESILNRQRVTWQTKGQGRNKKAVDTIDVFKVLIKWDGLPYDQATWELEPNFETNNCPLTTGITKKIHDSYMVALTKYHRKKKIDSRQNRVERQRVVFRVQDFKEITVQPATVEGGTLKNYQFEGLNWLVYKWLSGTSCILADEMGLGKTVQLIAFTSVIYHGYGFFPFLIVAPNSTILQWKREFAKWCPDMVVVVYTGNQESRNMIRTHELFTEDKSPINTLSGKKKQLKAVKFHVVLTTYEFAVVDANLLGSIDWEMVVIDEGQRLKNDESKLFSCLKEFHVNHRVLLTGTPLQNNLRELYNLLSFLDPVTFNNPSWWDEGFSSLTKEKVGQLHEQLRPYFLRRTKQEVIKELPAKVEVIVPIAMSPLQRKLYKMVLEKNYRVLSGGSKNTTRQTSLKNILMQLRKICNHPFLLPNEEPETEDTALAHDRLIHASAKLSLLNSMLRELKAAGHRVLIFSQMTKMLDILEDYVAEEGYKFVRLDGDMPRDDRQDAIDKYNEPDSDIFIFLLSTRAGGVGINLSTADTVIIFDCDFNPQVDLQAMARAHRINSTKKVMVYKFVIRGSIEEKIVQLGKHKLIMDHLIVEKMDDKTLRSTDIDDILKYGAKELFDSNDVSEVRFDKTMIDQLLDRNQQDETVGSEEIIELEEDEIEKDVNDAGADTKRKSKKNGAFSFARVWSLNESATCSAGEDTSQAEIHTFWDDLLKERIEKQQEKDLLAERERNQRRRKPLIPAFVNLDALDGDDAETDEEYKGDSDASSEYEDIENEFLQDLKAENIKDTEEIVFLGKKEVTSEQMDKYVEMAVNYFADVTFTQPKKSRNRTTSPQSPTKGSNRGDSGFSDSAMRLGLLFRNDYLRPGDIIKYQKRAHKSNVICTGQAIIQHFLGNKLTVLYNGDVVEIQISLGSLEKLFHPESSQTDQNAWTRFQVYRENKFIGTFADFRKKILEKGRSGNSVPPSSLLAEHNQAKKPLLKQPENKNMQNSIKQKLSIEKLNAERKPQPMCKPVVDKQFRISAPQGNPEPYVTKRSINPIFMGSDTRMPNTTRGSPSDYRSIYYPNTNVYRNSNGDPFYDFIHDSKISANENQQKVRISSKKPVHPYSHLPGNFIPYSLPDAQLPRNQARRQSSYP